VVHDYGDVCQSITELAIEMAAPISAEDFRALNACLDDAIARAVTEYERGWDLTSIDGGSVRALNERVGLFSHELRNLINTALLAFEVLKSGRVGVSGSTGNVLQRSLAGASDLIGRSLSEVRVKRGVQNPQLFSVSGFIAELAPAAILAADAAGITLVIEAVEHGLSVEADRQILAAAVMNLLQNAFKFTHARSTVTLRVAASADRVLLEIQDECGGLPDGDVNGIFRPFEQKNADRSGLGLGLAFSRSAVEANHGRINARNLPGVGCVFTVDLPLCAAPAVAVG
jgi:signal transduction histidine kinase